MRQWRAWVGWLGVLILVGSSARPRPTLPPLPTSVLTVRGEVPVRLVTDLICHTPTGPVPANGCYSAGRLLEIRAGLPLAQQWIALCHEEVHIAARETGIPYGPDSALMAREEQIARAVGWQCFLQRSS